MDSIPAESVEAVGGVFAGRDVEVARIRELMAAVQQGQAGLLTIEGDSGIGKTALARRSVGRAAGWTVLWSQGDAAETDLGYGIVAQVVRGLSPRAKSVHPILVDDLARYSAIAVGGHLLGAIGERQMDGPVAIVIDDVQWADRASVEALSFAFRRLSVDPVLVVVLVRGGRDSLDQATRRMLLSIGHRRHVLLSGLDRQDLGPLAAALGAASLDHDVFDQLYERTGGHTLYLQTLLSDPDGIEQITADASAIPPSLGAAIGDQLAVIPPPTRALLDMLAVLNARLPLAGVADAAGVEEPSVAIEPAVRAGLVDFWWHEPSRPVAIRHALQRDAIYGAMAAEDRRRLHARAVTLVDDAAALVHRVASLDRPDEVLAAELEGQAGQEAAGGRLSLAATHLQWAADISPGRDDRERPVLTAALHLMLAEESRGFALEPVVEASSPSALRSCVLGAMAFSYGHLAEAEQWFRSALEEALADPDGGALAAMVANRLAGTYALLGAGDKVQDFGRQALSAGHLDEAATSQTRTLIAIAAAQLGGADNGLVELRHLPVDPARVDLLDVDGLWWRGVFRLLVGDLATAVSDMTTSLRMVLRGATITLGLRVYSYLALAQYLSGDWDEVLLTSGHGFSAAEIRPRRYDLPLLHLAAGCVAAGRGLTAEAESHAGVAEEVAASLDYDHERPYAAMARAFVFQAVADYSGIAKVLSPWRDETRLDARSRMYAVLWRPLLIEGLIGSDQFDAAEEVLAELRVDASGAAYLQPARAWLEGWMAERKGLPDVAHEFYQLGEETAESTSPVYTSHLLLAHGRLLRRTGRRRQAVERLRRAHRGYIFLRAAPFIARCEQELAACGLPKETTGRRSVMEMTGRETDVAHLVERGMTNAEIAAELFITPKAVEYHLGNVYAKLGLKGRQQLRRFLADSRQPSA